MTIRVVDASCLIAFLENGAGADEIEVLLGRAIEGKYTLIMSALVMPSIIALLAPKMTSHAIDEMMRNVLDLPIRIVPMDADIKTAKIVAQVNCDFGMSLEESHAVALADLNNGILFSTNPRIKLANGRAKIKLISEECME